MGDNYTDAEDAAAAPVEPEVSKGLSPAMQQYLTRFQPPDAISGVNAGDPVGPISHMQRTQAAENLATKRALAGPPDAISGVNAGDPTGPIQHMREAQHAAAMQWPGAAESIAVHSALLQHAAANDGQLHPASAQVPGHDIREEAIARAQSQYQLATAMNAGAKMKAMYNQASGTAATYDPNAPVHAAIAQTLMAPVAAMAAQSTHPTLVPQHIQKMLQPVADPMSQHGGRWPLQAAAPYVQAPQQAGQTKMQAPINLIGDPGIGVIPGGS